MIHIPELRTRRLCCAMREISIGDSIAILEGVAPHRYEQGTTAILRAVCGTDVAAAAGGMGDPAAWTIQERWRAISHYIGALAEPDFIAAELDGESYRYSEYLVAETDYPTVDMPIALGEVGGDFWHGQPLTGAMAEAIERLQGDVFWRGNPLNPYAHWVVGCMAAMLIRVGETARPDPIARPSDYEDWLRERMLVLLGYPDSDWEKIEILWEVARMATYHLMAWAIEQDGGLVVLGREGAARRAPPARFPVFSLIGDRARALCPRLA